MSYIDSQLQGKFKNIPFNVTKESLDNVGQSWVKHTYPKSGVQYLEPMGENPFEATVDLFFKGENYLEDFEAFKKAIQDPAAGRLYLPSYGIFDGIKAEPSSFSTDQKSLGNISASIHFSSSIDRPAPIDAVITEQDVASKAIEATAVLSESFIADYTEPEIGNNLSTAVSDAGGLAESVKEITGKIAEIKNFLRKIDGVIRQVDNYAALLLNPGQPLGLLQSLLLDTRNTGAFSLYSKLAVMGSNLSNSMNDIDEGITPTISTVFPAVPILLEVDTTIQLWDTDTLERTLRNDGRIAIVNTFRMAGLIGMFEAAANASYTTTEEIDKTILILENYYSALIEDDNYILVIARMKTIIDELKNLTDKVLARKRQQAYGVIEIEEVRPISGFLLAYKLYGEYIQNESQLDYMANLIVGLNRSQPAHALQGVIRVVEIA